MNEMYCAVYFYEKGKYGSNIPVEDGRTRRKPKYQDVKGFQMSKEAHQVLLALVPTAKPIPRSRIVEYQYLASDGAPEVVGNYFKIAITEEDLPTIAKITRTAHHPGVYVYMRGRWHNAPQVEEYKDGEMGSYTVTSYEPVGAFELGMTPLVVQQVETRQFEKTKLRIVDEFVPRGEGMKVPFVIATPPGNEREMGSQSADRNPAGFPLQIIGNGMVLEWKKGYEDKDPIWWLRDEQKVSKEHSATYAHYSTVKSVPHMRWSRSFSAWYFIGGATPHQTLLNLVGYQPVTPAVTTPEVFTVKPPVAPDVPQDLLDLL
ncbi:MAG: hypothetical protein HC892_00390 [Saprospiraceae bacterium]|nr:hypothetical protein [Saprospiraceae bacterium]